jgi:hypothetical protein
MRHEAPIKQRGQATAIPEKLYLKVFDRDAKSKGSARFGGR